MRKTFLSMIMVLISIGATAQSGKLKKADNYYENIAYAEAIPLYTDLIGSTVDSPRLKAKLADCYFQIGETQKSEEYFSEVVSTKEATPDDVYKYAQSLKENLKYAESDKWMAQFHTMSSGDSRGVQFDENKTYIQEIERQGAYFSIQHLNMNTDNAEFGGYPVNTDEVYFISNRKKRAAIKRSHTWNGKAYMDIYSASSTADQELENLNFRSKRTNKKYHEGPLCFTSDGKKVYFTRNNLNGKGDKGIINLNLYAAEIDTEGKWYNEKELSLNSKDYSTGHPALSSDGKTMYFASDMPGGFGGADLYKMTVNEDGTFGSPENLGAKVNTEGQEMFPWITSEGTLFFASDGHLGLGGLDVFAAIPESDNTFGKILNVGKPVNGPKDDFALIMSSDNMSGYVSSNRSTGSGDDDIYSFKLLKPLKINLSLKGVVTDMRSNEILPGATVNLIDVNGDVVGSTTANEKGEYTFDLEPDQDYTLAVSKDDYFENGDLFSTKSLIDGQEEFTKNLTLEKDPGLALYTLITDAKTGKPIEGVSLTIIDNITGREFASGSTESTGDLLNGISDKKIDDRVSYNIQLIKEGYFPKKVTFNHKITEAGVINVHEFLEGGLSMDVAVEDLTELVKINPINFDLNKYNIRPDAQVELDKIVEVMNKYPNMEVELGSHTDCRASKAYNMRLSDKRAKASAAYIKSKITNPNRIYGKGYGESILLNGCACEGSLKSDCSEDEHEKNRRTEFKVISIGQEGVKVENSSTDSFGN